MKKLFFFYTISAMFVLSSCVKGGEDTVYPAVGSGTSLSVIEFNMQGGKMTYQVESTGEWMIFGNSEWATVYPASGTGNATVTFTAPAYPYYWEVRNFEFVLAENGSNYTYITVTQRGDVKASLSVEEGDMFVIAPEGGERTVTIKSNTDWEITGTNQWCQVYPREGKGDAEISVTVYENPYAESRSNVLRILGNGVSDTQILTVNQNQYNL